MFLITIFFMILSNCYWFTVIIYCCRLIWSHIRLRLSIIIFLILIIKYLTMCFHRSESHIIIKKIIMHTKTWHHFFLHLSHIFKRISSKGTLHHLIHMIIHSFHHFRHIPKTTMVKKVIMILESIISFELILEYYYR